MARIGRSSLVVLATIGLASVGLAAPASAEANLQGSVGGVTVNVRVDDGQMAGSACGQASIDIQVSGNYQQLQVNLEAEAPNAGYTLNANIMGYDSDDSIQDQFDVCPQDSLAGIYTVTGSIEVDGTEAPLTTDTFEVTSTTVKFANTRAVVKGSSLRVSGIVRYVTVLGAAPASGQVEISYRLPKSGGGFGAWKGLGSVGLEGNGSYRLTQSGGLRKGAQVKVVFQGNDGTQASTIVNSH